MKRSSTLIVLIAILALPCFSQKKIWDETPEQKKDRMAWWTDARFGMFIHWGLYAQPARHEWVKQRERMNNESYGKYFELFNPDLFDAEEWAKKAKDAGMKYAVITSKHHEGFNMFDSEYTDYKVTNTPYGKDIIKEWVNAFRAEGLKVGFYHSLIDWHHPHYTIDRIHPQRLGTDLGWGQQITDPEKLDELDKKYSELNKAKDFSIYREYLHKQVREILTNYGTIDILWLDYSYPGRFGKGRDDWDSEKLIKMVRELQPGIIIDDRADLKDYWGGWDFVTPEQTIPPEWPLENGEKAYWETCATFSGSWGYYRDEHKWKDNPQLITMLIETVSKGGNLLLNVGPTARGTFDHRADQALSGIGEWMKYNDRSIYGCTKAPNHFEVPEGTMITYHPGRNCLYIHVTDYPAQWLRLPGYAGKIRYAQFLHDASEIQFQQHWKEGFRQDIVLKLPTVKPNVEIPVIEIFLNE